MGSLRQRGAYSGSLSREARARERGAVESVLSRARALLHREIYGRQGHPGCRQSRRRRSKPVSDRSEIARRNGARSNGPKTDAGRARSALNAIRHGLRAESLILAGLETADEWEKHVAATFGSLKPATYLEALLVERVAVQSWRLRRVARVEQAVAAVAMYKLNLFGNDIAEEEADKEARVRRGVEIETRIMEHRTAALPGEWMEQVSRYETSLERSLFRSLAELRLERENAPLEGALVEPATPASASPIFSERTREATDMRARPRSVRGKSGKLRATVDSELHDGALPCRTVSR